MVQYEVIEFYYGSWVDSWGKYDNLHDAVERKKFLDLHKQDMNEYYYIIVVLPRAE